MSLEVHELAVGHDGVALQRAITFTLAPGERLAVVGPSGCGKTTLLRAIATLDAPLAGTLSLDGVGPAELGYPRWRSRVLYASQRATFFGGSARDELRRAFRYRSARRAYDEQAARDAMGALGLGHKLDARAGELSEGERQRLALVRSALLGPDVLLLDEPTSALDTETTAAVEAFLDGLGAALVIVTHDPAQRDRVSQRTLTLEAPDAR